MSNSDSLLKNYLVKSHNPDITEQEMSMVLKFYTDIRPRLESFVFNDDSTQIQLQLEGTIPVPIQANVYNIPIRIWIPDTYPFSPPLVYVRPTSSMKIRNSGQYVDSFGKVILPYLQNWTWPKTCLLGLFQLLTVKFTEECPVFNKVPSNDCVSD